MVGAVRVEPTTSAPQTPSNQIAEFRLYGEPLSKTISVPVKRLPILPCDHRTLANFMVELKCGNLSILDHTLRNIIPLVGNQGESEVGSTEGWEQTVDYIP